MGFTGFTEAAGDRLRTTELPPSRHTHVVVDATQLIIGCMFRPCGGVKDLLRNVHSAFMGTMARAQPSTPLLDADNALGHIVVTHDRSDRATHAKWYERMLRDMGLERTGAERVDGGDPTAPPLNLDTPLTHDTVFPVGWQKTLRSRKGRARVFEAVAQHLLEVVPPVPGTTFTLVGPGVGADAGPVRHRAVVSVVAPTGPTTYVFQDMPLGGLDHLFETPAEASTGEASASGDTPPPPPTGLGEADHVGPTVLAALLAQYPRFEVDEPSVVFLGSTDSDAVTVWSTWLLARQAHGPCNFQVYLDTAKPRAKPATGEAPEVTSEEGATEATLATPATSTPHQYVHINRCIDWATEAFPRLDRASALINLLGCLALTCGTDVSIKIPRTSARSSLPTICSNAKADPTLAPFSAKLERAPGVFPRLLVDVNTAAWRSSWWPGLAGKAALPKSCEHFDLAAAARQAAFYLQLSINDAAANKRLHEDPFACGFRWARLGGKMVCVPLNANPDKLPPAGSVHVGDAVPIAGAGTGVAAAAETQDEPEGSPSKRLRL
jgi:hypothetical protein